MGNSLQVHEMVASKYTTGQAILERLTEQIKILKS